MDILGKHRVGFNNLGVQLFADLERDRSMALKKGSSEKVDLERAIAEQKELVQERQALIDAYEDTSEQQQQKIRDQESRLQNLGYEIAKAKIENEALAERLEGIEKADRGRQRRAIPVDEATQTLFSYKDGEVQTDSIPSLEDLKKAYQELASSYNDIRYELDQYKEAYNRLAEKCAHNKAVWKQWSEQENARLINSKKRRIDRGTTEPQTIGRKFNGYIALATPITGGSPTPRAPNISPLSSRNSDHLSFTHHPKRRSISRVSRIRCWRGGGMKGSFEPVDGNTALRHQEPAGDSAVPTVPTNTSTVLSVPPTDLTILTALASNSAVLPSPPSDSTILPVVDSNSTVLPSPPAMLPSCQSSLAFLWESGNFRSR
ncbi:hypothetical protein B9Z19DRAFT_1134183 [Tuber borchii]|uniref:Uncharacterized protein n=1 Tax=Tuber borchii TaxID=42251 RepID=A0A2T6ZEK0_TUBBO|nr:hypothetical protein B9Z19DRAFT_1134183 [Tuber borchii]